MKCPVCSCSDHRVIDTTESGDAIRRRRKCDRCRHRWTTLERADVENTLQVQATDLAAIRDRLGDLIAKG